ncbi:putative membrane protein [Candidatus Ichthyocystis hellenicum]|uniref:Putative membrane protein n=1 Tax=Candidatus Ichthyocystis hellenicum TaxID=1561003 RepID=A0A0S4M2W4_9BURK|nr:putative membrane protein [Candidatus Ichthyocystis hellenicum]
MVLNLITAAAAAVAYNYCFVYSSRGYTLIVFSYCALLSVKNYINFEVIFKMVPWGLIFEIYNNCIFLLIVVVIAVL